MRSASATEVPPNFITTVSTAASADAWAASVTALKDSFRPLPGPNYRRRRLVAALVLLVVAAGVVAAVRALTRDSGASGPLVASSTGPTGPIGTHSFLEKVLPSGSNQSNGPTVPRGVADLADRLPLERKVAQLFLVGFTGTDTGAPVFGDLGRLDLGGLVFHSGNYTGPQQLAQLTTFAAQVARQHKHVPPWLMTTQDGGEFSELSGLPPADPPSAISTVRRAASEAAQAARSLRALGINGVLGPDVDVDTDPGGPYTRVAFSNDPDQVALFAAATVRAYASENMLTTPKYFPGLGAANEPTDQGSATVGLSLDALAKRDLVPFKAALDAGSEGVMLGHGLYTTDGFATPASQSSNLATALLRGNLRFDGVAVTDDLESPAISDTQSVADAAVASIKAGADMVYVSGPRADQTAAYLAVLNAARRGDIPSSRLNAAITHILLAKKRLHLITQSGD
jgi:beta-N-acetylhexosaminidase